jgi:serine protease Do
VQAAVRLAPGNSGGPLVDAAGRLVGINTMVVSNGIALAIPSSIVAEFARKGAGPRLGVTVQPVTLTGQRLGLLVLSVEEGSPAERASLLIGDILVGANGGSLREPEDLPDSIAAAANGVLGLRFLRGDHTRERRVAIALFDRARREAA